MSTRIDFAIIGEDKMHCSGCEGRIQFALKRLPGVEHVAADARTQRVTVAFDPAQVTPDQVRERLDQVGFEVEVAS